MPNGCQTEINDLRTQGRDPADCAPDLRVSWWALEDLNLRPLPCQGRQGQASDQRLRSSDHFGITSGAPSSTAWFGRLLRPGVDQDERIPLDLVMARGSIDQGPGCQMPGPAFAETYSNPVPSAFTIPMAPRRSTSPRR